MKKFLSLLLAAVMLASLCTVSLAEAAAPVELTAMFWGGNDIYWKTRWETSEVDGVEYRTLVCYKETWANTNPNAGPADYVNLDPADIWTGTWRDTRYEVRVCQDGFEWSGQVYGSLSAVARAITGVNRNGYEFFGIREKARNE